MVVFDEPRSEESPTSGGLGAARAARYLYTYDAGRMAVSANLFLYDGWNMIAELNNPTTGDSSTNFYVWGQDISGTLQGAGGIGGLLSVTKSDGTYFPFCDANGNITEYADTNGTIVAHYEFDPYGNVIAATGDQAEDFSFRFSSKSWDDETGLGYWGYRYYSAGLGRWMGRDPIEELGGINLYEFAENEAIGSHDPQGLSLGTWAEDVEANAALLAAWAGAPLINRPLTASFLGQYLDEHNSGRRDLTLAEMQTIIVNRDFRRSMAANMGNTVVAHGPGPLAYVGTRMHEHAFHNDPDGDLWSAFNDIHYQYDMNGDICRLAESRFQFRGIITVRFSDDWGFSDPLRDARTPFMYMSLPDHYRLMPEGRFRRLESRGWTKPFHISGTRSSRYELIVDRNDVPSTELRLDPYNN